MPLHDFECPAGHTQERNVPAGTESYPCFCGRTAHKVFLRMPMGIVQADICYDSPIDGRPITSKQARLEDLARNNCMEYEPGMRQDMERRKREDDQALERAVERSVDEFFATAPARKLERLESELRAGADVQVTR